MNKSLTAALIVGAGAAGFGAGTIAQATPPVPTTKLVNVRLIRATENLPDGGSKLVWVGTSCVYIMPTDGGTVQDGERCRDSRVDGALFAPVEKALVSP